MLRYLSHTTLRRKRVLTRVDFNVPISRGAVGDKFRLRAALPTIQRLLRAGNTVILLAHHSNRRQTLAPIAPALAHMLSAPVAFLKNPFRAGRGRAREARVFLVENLRFWKGEEAGSIAFARALARIGDAFVNDAFGAAHRRGASLTLLPRYLPSCLGLLFERELRELDLVLKQPRRPLIAVFGGAKTETKLPILQRFSRFADRVLVGGAIANTLLRARGLSIGRSPVERGLPVGRIRRIARSRKVVLPVDAVVASSPRSRRGRIRRIGAIAAKDILLDIGPKTELLFKQFIAGGRTVVWNGPMGITEAKPFTGGTLALARALARSRARVVVGGGDTVAFLNRTRLVGRFTYVSTGGGAMLAYLAGEKLPALEALRRSRPR